MEELGSVNSVRVQCTFIPGSDATGCMVTFVGELTNTTVNLTRMDNEIDTVINHELPFPLSCYHQVFALDIEGDGSLGTLPVPAVIDVHSTDQTCQTTDEKASHSKWCIGLLILYSYIQSLSLSHTHMHTKYFAKWCTYFHVYLYVQNHYMYVCIYIHHKVSGAKDY